MLVEPGKNGAREAATTKRGRSKSGSQFLGFIVLRFTLKLRLGFAIENSSAYNRLRAIFSPYFCKSP